ncbi:PREDICTED: tyrosine-protein phosphatase non-receptor type substrate 1-like [Thamnophis sirtalis]|uniref:Tyrosine-protein phosphatase non-receptor type substrate 1-like n=1 Tax=Thamnophis sirtalis TaxID=35019 RepID=A0A6I9YX93_9SAUR|nr:PREDICTED: tyrosine-protein phosphatase non-receptor type substrate 1-like [Thamnophis sirtalis]
MASLRCPLAILGPFYLWCLLLVQELRMCSFQKREAGLPGITTEPRIPDSTFVQVTIGTTLTLNCTLAQTDLPTSARWYKTWSNNRRKLIYKDDDHFSRGERLVPESRTDFSIGITIVSPEDNGTYFCILTNKVPQGEEFSIKTQVAVLVTIPPTVHLETHPPSPVQLNASVTVICKAEYYYPNGAKVDLFCKDPKGKGKSSGTIYNSNRTYSHQSSLKITATQNWNSSLFTCLVKHNSTVIKATTRLVVTTEEFRKPGLLVNLHQVCTVHIIGFPLCF